MVSPHAERTTPAIELTVWGRALRLGNLVKPGGVHALCWYTAEFEGETWVFDAMALPGMAQHCSLFGGAAVDDDVRMLPALLERAFTGEAAFVVWVKQHFYALPSTT